MHTCDPHGTYDAVVVGSGPGGLAAACRLASEGLRVLVLEKDSRAGGTVLSYPRSGFLIPRGPLGYANVHLVRKVLEPVEARPPATYTRLRYLLFGEEGPIPLSLSFGELAQRLASFFPGEGGIGDFFDEIRRLYRGVGDGLPPSGLELDEEWRDPYSRASRLIGDPRLLRLLLGMGAPEPYAAPLLVSSWNLVAERGIFRPDGGTDSLIFSLLEKAFIQGPSPSEPGSPGPTARGGFVLLTSCPVEEISVRGGKVKGVKAGGRYIPCGMVISNADVKTTLLRLLPQRALEPEHRRFLEGRKLSPSLCQVCLEADAGCVDLSPFREAEVLMETRPLSELAGTDEPASHRALRNLQGSPLEIALLPSRGGPSSRSIALLLRSPSRWEDYLSFRPAPGHRRPAYLALKREIARIMTERASNLLPGLQQGSRVLDVATPLTFEERGGRWQGAAAGWSWTDAGSNTWGVELVLTPVEGLYLAGHQAFSTMVAGGIPTALLTGLRAAEYALAGKGPAPLPAF